MWVRCLAILQALHFFTGGYLDVYKAKLARILAGRREVSEDCATVQRCSTRP